MISGNCNETIIEVIIVLVFNNGKLIKVSIFEYGNIFMAMASTKDYSVRNCYATTRKKAIELSLFRLKQELDQSEEELEVLVVGD
jgi:hypothetical protein